MRVEGRPPDIRPAVSPWCGSGRGLLPADRRERPRRFGCGLPPGTRASRPPGGKAERVEIGETPALPGGGPSTPDPLSVAGGMPIPDPRGSSGHRGVPTVKESARYVKIVKWSNEDGRRRPPRTISCGCPGCFAGRSPARAAPLRGKSGSRCAAGRRSMPAASSLQAMVRVSKAAAVMSLTMRSRQLGGDQSRPGRQGHGWLSKYTTKPARWRTAYR